MSDIDDQEVREVLSSGKDVREYSTQVEKEFKEVENKSIEDYISQSQNIAKLHNQIGDCDQVGTTLHFLSTHF